MKTGVMIMAGCVTGMVILATQPATANEDMDFVVRWRSLHPEKNEDWASAGETKLQLRFWETAPVGVALAVGVGRWKARNDYYSESDETGSFSMAINGYLTTVPVGVSLLHRSRIKTGLDLVMEAGLQYVFCDSQVMVETRLADVSGTDRYLDVVDIDNAVTMVLGAGIETRLSEGLSLQVGIGWNGNILNPSERFLGENIGFTSLGGTSLDLGLAWRF